MFNQLVIKKFSLVFFILLFAISCEEQEENNDSEDAIRTGLLTKVLNHDSKVREYLLYVPNNYNPELKYPLMINFHGFGGYAKDFVNEADMRNLAEDQNFFVVYPQGTLLGGSPHWNSSAPSPDNKSSADDLGFVETMIDAISAEYSVESKRIYAAGYSNGGFLSYFLACNSKRFAAIGSVAGTMIDDSYKSCNASVPTAMINIHGTADKTVPYDGDGYGSTSIPDVINWWKNFNSCFNEDVISNQSGSIEQYIFFDDNGNPYVQHIKIYDGGHYWDDKLSFNGKNTSGLIWDFVSQFDINGTIN